MATGCLNSSVAPTILVTENNALTLSGSLISIILLPPIAAIPLVSYAILMVVPVSFSYLRSCSSFMASARTSIRSS